MSSVEQLNDLNAAGVAWLARANQMADELAAYQAGYAALAANLRGVVYNIQNFICTVDPDEANPTPVDGGVFNSIGDIQYVAPRGAFIQVHLLPGKEYVLDEQVFVYNQFMRLVKEGEGANPVVKPIAYETGDGFNGLYGFVMRGGGLEFSNVDADLTADRANVGLPWQEARQSLIVFPSAGNIAFGMSGSTITGANNANILTCRFGQTAHASFNFCIFDGAVTGVDDVDNGIATVAEWATTLLNGAQVTSGGVLGQNLLKT